MNVQNIWNCVECDAWSRDFDYEEYIDLYNKRNEGHSMFSEDGYRALCAVFEDEMART